MLLTGPGFTLTSSFTLATMATPSALSLSATLSMSAITVLSNSSVTVSRWSRESLFCVRSISLTASLLIRTVTPLFENDLAAGCSLTVTVQSATAAASVQVVPPTQSCTPNVSLVVSASRLTVWVVTWRPRTVLVVVVIVPAATSNWMRPLRMLGYTRMLAPGATAFSRPRWSRAVTFMSLLVAV